MSVVLAAGVIGAMHLTFTGSSLGLFPVKVPFSWSVAWCGVLVVVCWLWSLIVDVTARQWSWASSRASVPIPAAVEAALLTVVLAPLPASRIDLQIIESTTSSAPLPHLLDLRGAEPTLVVVLVAAVILPVAGRLAPALATPPANPDRCAAPISDSDKLYLIDHLRKYGGTIRESQRDGTTYLEVSASPPGNGGALAEQALSRPGVDTVESKP
ncbi:hypothetical protein OHS18_17545 [Amycolatopsis sp. NBC_00355]|uniref:hypothetical protein n=1 Tax=Amycolatopsis sp. NBC_00355 TaxID=2975957 RepID=UPI002E252B91